MARLLLALVAIVIAVWFVFAIARAFSALVHLALLIAIVVVAVNLVALARKHARER